MSKFIIAIIACVSLSGCFYQTVNQYDINRAIALCGSVANIHQIGSYSLGEERLPLVILGSRSILVELKENANDQQNLR